MYFIVAINRLLLVHNRYPWLKITVKMDDGRADF